MKQLLIYTFCTLSIVFSACSSDDDSSTNYREEKQIIGLWKLKQIGFKDTDTIIWNASSTNTYLEFNKDKTYTRISSGYISNGFWKIDIGYLIFKYPSTYNQTETYKIISIDDQKLIILNYAYQNDEGPYFEYIHK